MNVSFFRNPVGVGDVSAEAGQSTILSKQISRTFAMTDSACLRIVKHHFFCYVNIYSADGNSREWIVMQTNKVKLD